MTRCAIGVLCFALALSGCAVHEVHKDHDKIRTALLDLYTNQIMDNLVRTANGMPIIQIDYTRVTGMVTIKNTIGGSENQAATANNVLALPAATLSATRTIVTTLAGNLANENSNQITLEAVPLITSNEVYDAYLQYLDPVKNPGSLLVTCDRPPPGAAHMCQKYNGMYYWVPIEHRALFFRLALLTTAQRGKSLNAPDEFYAVTANLEKSVPNNLFKNQVVLTLRLSKKIPADLGMLTLDSDKTATFDLQSIPQDRSDTDVAVIHVDKDKAQLFAAPQPVKIFLQHQRPKPPSTEDLLNRNNFILQQIQNNLVP